MRILTALKLVLETVLCKPKWALCVATRPYAASIDHMRTFLSMALSLLSVCKACSSFCARQIHKEFHFRLLEDRYIDYSQWLSKHFLSLAAKKLDHILGRTVTSLVSPGCSRIVVIRRLQVMKH